MQRFVRCLGINHFKVEVNIETLYLTITIYFYTSQTKQKNIKKLKKKFINKKFSDFLNAYLL